MPKIQQAKVFIKSSARGMCFTSKQNIQLMLLVNSSNTSTCVSTVCHLWVNRGSARVDDHFKLLYFQLQTWLTVEICSVKEWTVNTPSGMYLLVNAL